MKGKISVPEKDGRVDGRLPRTTEAFGRRDDSGKGRDGSVAGGSDGHSGY